MSSRIGLFGQISEINDHLFLSGAGVLKPEKLKQKKINCIINATTEEPNAYLPGIDYLKIRIDDNPFAHLDHYFDQVADKIRSVKDRGGRTLVHCVAGVSRSASLCIVYLIKYERMTLRQAYHFVKSARPIIRPNVGFWKQMIDFERKLRGHATVSMVTTTGCDLLIPDVYCNDLRRHIMNQFALESAAATNGHLMKLSKIASNRNHHSTSSPPPPMMMMMTSANGSGAFGKRRGISASGGRPASSIATYRRSTSPSVGGGSIFNGVASSAVASHRLATTTNALFSPAPSRKQRGIFGNINRGDALFPTF